MNVFGSRYSILSLDAITAGTQVVFDLPHPMQRYRDADATRLPQIVRTAEFAELLLRPVMRIRSSHVSYLAQTRKSHLSFLFS